MNYYRRYPGDYLGDTQHLSMLQHGAYCLLLDYCYSRDTSRAPDDLSTSYRICRASTPAERAAVRQVLTEFFPASINRRIERQLPEELSRIQVARENGSRGGRPTSKPTGFSGNNPAGSLVVNPELTQVESSPTPTPTPTPSPSPTPTPTKAKDVLAHRANGARQADTYSPAFEACWAGRPRRSGADSKLAASRAWRARLQEGVTEEAMAAGMCRYRAWCEANGKIGTEFTMQAERFFGPRHYFYEEWKNGPAPDSFKEKEDKRKAAEWERQKDEFLKKGAIDGEVVSDE